MKYIIIALCLLGLVMGDVYMHHPRGSNDRNRERNENRNNANRLFDSQNNAKGGYPYCGNATVVDDTDGLELYAGSILRIEWTVQHSCGPDSDALCSVVIQYGCEDSLPYLRDGYPSDDQPLESNDDNNDGYLRATFVDNNDAGTNRIPCPQGVSNCNGQADFGDDEEDYINFYAGQVVTTTNGATRYGGEYGYHESFDFYRDQCLETERNHGLYTSDQDLNGDRARFTRQNPNGNRHGFECPEERDYYPWWQPSPWKDVAVLVTSDDWCEFYQAESQNVKSRSYCEGADASQTTYGLTPIFEDACQAAGGTWMTQDAWGIEAPDCLLHAYSRDNHLGNAVQVDSSGNIVAEAPQMAYYDWTLPEEVANQKCVIRLRYNMSGVDYPSMNGFKVDFDEAVDGEFWDFAYNCEAIQNNGDGVDDVNITIDPDAYDQCDGVLTDSVVPLYNRPYVEVFEGEPALAIAFNTNQVSRTFQDRSYVFRGLERPSDVPDDATIWNLGYRGRRGNIVQCYPAVEYDFVPTNLTIDENTYVHIQFCGSDFNTARNPNNGEGWQYSDRTNMLQVRSLQTQFPLPTSAMEMWGNDEDLALTFAYSGTDRSEGMCIDAEDIDGDADNSIFNCGTLNNAPARFDGGLQQFPSGTYHYISTRNNNFSNRAQKGSIVVGAALTAGEVAGISIGVVALVGLSVGGAVWYGKKNPNSRIGSIVGSGTTRE
jgi:hypothetical protein